MPDLARMKCLPCRKSAPCLNDDAIAALLPAIPDWQLVEVEGLTRLQRSFPFKDFAEAMIFTGLVAALAEEADHHPRIVTEWGRVTVEWWTHVIGGLHRNDFIMAARTDRLMP